MNFREKRWQRNGNHYWLVGTNIAIYQWNTGANANFMVEERGKGTHTVHGKGAAASFRRLPATRTRTAPTMVPSASRITANRSNKPKRSNDRLPGMTYRH